MNTRSHFWVEEVPEDIAEEEFRDTGAVIAIGFVSAVIVGTTLLAYILYKIANLHLGW